MKYDIIIIGGGATGTAIFRDLAMRGLYVVLIEKNKIASGTTSASHQNLVGGMRYVIKDPIVAKECAEENRIISKIAPNLVERINNYFVGFKNDYTEKALAKAKKLDIRADEMNIKETFKEIPVLNKDLDIVIETDDKNIDAQKFCWLNCMSAKKNGGNLLENTDIYKIKRENNYILLTSEGTLEASYVINATGPWINAIAGKMNIKIPLLYSQGTIIVQKTLSPRGIQYFHRPTNADAYIVHGEYAWLGTTSTTINSPEKVNLEYWAEAYLKENFSIIIPKVKYQKILKNFIGVRPLFKEKNTKNGRAVSRDFRIIENPENFLHIVGGKLTTARLMAEKVSDEICKKVGINSKCKTDEESLEETTK